MAQARSLDVAGIAVPVSNLEKVLYPGVKFTKAQVIDYYVRVSEVLLPHLKDRPVTLKRYPDGVGGEHFYEKDAPGYAPKWVRTFPVPRKEGGPDIQYILINDLPALVWCANAASLELHPFLHRAPEIDRPTSVVFDLDPGEGTDLLQCIEVAFWLRELLDGMRLKAFPKVSGSKGLQVYVPLNSSTATYDATQAFARTIAERLERDHKGFVITEMSKALRKGKVFIDWSQNAAHKTTVGVYSLRAKRIHPFVSAPVRWEELEARDTHVLYFQPEALLKRVEEVGDLFAPVLTMRQQLPGSRLKTYARKRDFTRTPEPAGVEPAPRASRQGSRRRFVIQMHAASHLHFDFRLEMHDVLKSWAVPKGLPQEPGKARLGAATEDHPLEYIDFEGTIPKGQYGGGTVMVWDTGTYEIIEGNYYKGHLRIFLNGQKLQGEYVIARDAGQEKNWRITRVGKALKQPEDVSALTGRTMEEIAADRSSTWQSNRTRAGIDLESLPTAKLDFVEPMMAKLAARLPQGDGWSYEVKFDGYRTLALCGADGVRLLSRRGNSMNDRFASIADALAETESGTIFDGEVIALDAAGRPSFHVLQNSLRSDTPLLYYVFDLLAYRGRDVRSLALVARRKLLEVDAMTSLEAPVLFSASLDAPPAELLRAAREHSFEGVVAKRTQSVYEAGKRSGSWVKVKVDKGQELVIGGYRPGKDGFDNLAVGYYEGKRLMFNAKVRNGFTPEMKREVAAHFKRLATEECPFANLPEPRSARRGEALTAEAMKNYRWLKPKLVAQVDFTDWTEANHLRNSRFVGLRDDVDPRKVRRERAE